jgi:hypothetical protein
MILNKRLRHGESVLMQRDVRFLGYGESGVWFFLIPAGRLLAKVTDTKTLPDLKNMLQAELL